MNKLYLFVLLMVFSSIFVDVEMSLADDLPVIPFGQKVEIKNFNYQIGDQFSNDPTNPLPWPSNRVSTTGKNNDGTSYAYVGLDAYLGQAGVAQAWLGTQFTWGNLGNFTLEQVRSVPVKITVNFDYRISADWIELTGSSNAGVGMPNLTTMPWIDFIGYANNETTGSNSKNYTNTFTTLNVDNKQPLTVGNLSDWNNIIAVQLSAQAHKAQGYGPSNPFPDYMNAPNSSSAHVTLNSITIDTRPTTYGLFIGVNKKGTREDGTPIQLQGDTSVNEVRSKLVDLVTSRGDNIDTKLLSADIEQGGMLKSSIANEINTYKSKMKPNDNFVLYITAHGNDYNGQYFLETSQSESEFLTSGDLRTYLAQLDNVNKFVFIDSCHSGGFWENLKGLKRIALFTAAGAASAGYFNGYNGQTFFSHVVASAFTKPSTPSQGAHAHADVDGNDKISFDEMSNYIKSAPKDMPVGDNPFYDHDTGQPAIAYEMDFGDTVTFSPIIWNPDRFKTNDFAGLLYDSGSTASFLYSSFIGTGIWKYNNTGTDWTQITASNPQLLVTVGSTLYGTFSGLGIWKFDGTNWSQTTTSVPEIIVGTSSTLYGSFPGLGIWQWNGIQWSQTTPSIPQTIIASTSNLYGTFAGLGIWKFDGINWNQLTTSIPDMLVTSGIKLYGTFSGQGIWLWNGSTWTQATSSNPQLIAASSAKLYGSFTGAGIWEWDGAATWKQISTDTPTQMTASGTELYASFTGVGIKKWDGTSWSQISGNEPVKMVVGE